MSAQSALPILAFMTLLAVPALALEFTESAHCRANEIPLGQPARISGKREGRQVEVKVLANFGCGTAVGNANVKESGELITLSADTILPGHPTPACKCTRTLNYKFDARHAGALKVRFLKDGLAEGEGEVIP